MKIKIVMVYKMDIHKKFFSKIGFDYLILAITALILQLIIINIINLVSTDLIYDINFNIIISSICNYILPFPIFYYLLKKLDTTDIQKGKISPKKFMIYISISITLMWIGNIISLIITTLLGNLIESDIANPVQNLINNTDIMLNLIIISIIGPVFEELIFRKLLIDRTIKYGARVSIILSAIIFALFHGNLNQFFYALLLGGFFAYIYVKTGKIIYTIVLHIIINFMGSVISLFVTQSAMNLINNTFTLQDTTLILIYILIIAIAVIIGIISLFKYKKSKFNGSKTIIPLNNPLKTMFLNYGMICFTVFFILEIIYQTFL